MLRAVRSSAHRVVEFADRLFGREFSFYVRFLTEIEPYTERRAAQKQLAEPIGPLVTVDVLVMIRVSRALGEIKAGSIGACRREARVKPDLMLEHRQR